MGSLNPENEEKVEFNDSGYEQDYSAVKETSIEVLSKNTINLLDLSDDVLLYILKYCTPRDLKALGYSCPRLGALVLDRTLWVTVDARDTPTGRSRMQWLLSHALGPYTTKLRICGYAKEAKGCLGYMSGSRDDIPGQDGDSGASGDWNPFAMNSRESSERGGIQLMRLGSGQAQILQRYCRGFPYWPDTCARGSPAVREPPERTGALCPGPRATLTRASLRRLTTLCDTMTELALEYVVFDCNMTNICMFPKSLRKLSLRGTKCFNLEKSFLYKIQDHLILLEDLDVSYCEWIEPACMLPLSKMPRLTRLVMQECAKLSEFVAYASLATRYGFKTLKILDLRGCPVGDSEVSALGWVPRLEQLYLSPAAARIRYADHAHYSRDPAPPFTELTDWEEQEPEYYKSKYASEQWIEEERSGRHNRNVPYDATSVGSCVVFPYARNEAGTSQNADSGANSPADVANQAQSPPNEDSTEERLERLRAAMGYVISRGRESIFGNVHTRTVHMYPDADMEDENYQDPHKRKQEDGDGSGPSKRQKESVGSQTEDESKSCVDRESSNVDRESSNVDRESSSLERDGPSEQKGDDNERNSPEAGSSKEPCVTKASKKYYDDTNCQVSRTVPKDSLSDFKKRTQDAQDDNSKPDFIDFDDDNDPNTMENDDDGSDDDDDADDNDEGPQSKRSRMTVNEGASTSKCDPQPSTSCASNSIDQPNQSAESNFPNQSIITLVPYRPSISDEIIGDLIDRPVIGSPEIVPEVHRHGIRLDIDLPTVTHNERVMNPAVNEITNGLREIAQVISINNSVNRSQQIQNANREVINDDSERPLKCEPDYPSDNNPDNLNGPGHSSNKPSSSSENASGSTSNNPGPSSHNDLEQLSNNPGPSSYNDFKQLLNNPRPSSNNSSNDSGCSSNDSGRSSNDSGRSSGNRSGSPQKYIRFRHNEAPVVIEGYPDGCGSYNINNIVRNNISNNNNAQEPDWNNRQGPERSILISRECGSNQEQVLNLNPGSNNQPAAEETNADNSQPNPPERDPNTPESQSNVQQNTNTPESKPNKPESDPNKPESNLVTPESNPNIPERPPNIPERNPTAPDRHLTPPEATANQARRHRLLYVNVGRRRHAMYQISMPEPVDLRTQISSPHMNLVYSSQLAPRLEHSYLVTDSAIRRFGRADNDNINYVQIGPLGPFAAPFDDPTARPNRSNLRILSATGYNHITNASLNHLLTAAPRLRLIDFRGTRVTESAVEHFRTLRPECSIRFGPLSPTNEENPRPHSR